MALYKEEGVSTTGGLAFGGTGAGHPYEPAECRLSLDIGRVGGLLRGARIGSADS